MTAERWQQIELLFHGALEVPQEQRAAWLQSHCSGDEELRQEIELLLASDHPGGLELTEVIGGGAAVWSGSLPSGAKIGSCLGQYQINARLGGGGMGEVWRATDTRLGREVAIKILPDSFAAYPDRLARFRREARILAALNHPSIATIYDIGEVEGRAFLVMELLEGKTLRECIAGNPLEIEKMIAFATQIAEALDEAHGKGIIHHCAMNDNLATFKA